MIHKNKTLTLLLCLYGTLLATTIRCSSDDDPDPVDCNTVNIVVNAETSAPTGCAASDGSITATPTGGATPYQFALNGGALGSNNVFTGLSAGTYTVNVRDANGCTGSAEVAVTSQASTLNFTFVANQTACKESNGSIAITATGGSSVYEYRLDNGAFGASSQFTGLSQGTYSITVKDSEGCVTTKSAAVTTGVTYQSDIKQILDTNCAVSGCHVSGGAAPMSLTTYAVARNRANDIKNAVLSNVMPKGGPPLSQALKDKIACWADDNAPEN